MSTLTQLTTARGLRHPHRRRPPSWWRALHTQAHPHLDPTPRRSIPRKQENSTERASQERSGVSYTGAQQAHHTLTQPNHQRKRGKGGRTSASTGHARRPRKGESRRREAGKGETRRPTPPGRGSTNDRRKARARRHTPDRTARAATRATNRPPHKERREAEEKGHPPGKTTPPPAPPRRTPHAPHRHPPTAAAQNQPPSAAPGSPAH